MRFDRLCGMPAKELHLPALQDHLAPCGTGLRQSRPLSFLVWTQIPEAIAALLLTNPDGAQVALADVADVYQRTGRYSIAHEGTRRRQAVYCNLPGRDIVG